MREDFFKTQFGDKIGPEAESIALGINGAREFLRMVMEMGFTDPLKEGSGLSATLDHLSRTATRLRTHSRGPLVVLSKKKTQEEEEYRN